MPAPIDANASSSTVRRIGSAKAGVRVRWFSLLLWLACLPVLAASPSGTSTTAPAPVIAGICAGCHGIEGEGNASGIPRLAGMDADYLAHTLIAFKTGQRASDTMQPIAGALSDTDISVLAKYFATRRPSLVPSTQPFTAEMVAAGTSMALQGDGKDIPACFSCHGAAGRGQGERYPAIASEPAAYLVNRLHEFQERARHGTPKPGSMTEVASRLTETEIRDVAAYLSALPPG